ncbi:RNA polymerase sigma factor [Rhizorhabdus dicambivorans]|uniref:RNA polymerase sigma factor n=1 Tax=Rhizorhabdus dicambivorans TaxID=1850238 RepID=UPI000833799B|nr:RNA polymerase sigma factor [Rhizorhabdus dicambivorans]
MVDLARIDWFKASILPHERALRACLRRASTAGGDIDDIVSEALVRAYGTEDWVRIGDGRHYLFRIARNVLIDHARRNALVAFDSLDDAGDGEADHRTEAAISARDELRQVQRAIEAMPPQCRRVFVLRRVHERSIGEIAAEMGLSISTVEKHLGKAVALLARVIAEIEEGSFGRGGEPAQRGGGPAGPGGAFLCPAAR